VIRNEGRLQRARAAKPLNPRRDLGVIQVRMIAAGGADELKHAGVAAFETAVHDADRLAPHERRPAVAGLTGKRERVVAVGAGAQPRVTAIMRARYGDGGRAGSRSGTGHAVRVARTAQSTHRQRCRGLEQRARYHLPVIA
jgi:hypothetical protein